MGPPGVLGVVHGLIHGSLGYFLGQGITFCLAENRPERSPVRVE